MCNLIEEVDDDMEICKAWKDMMDEMMEKGKSKGKIIGRNEGKSEIISNMLKNNFQPEEIARITGIDLKEVEEIEKN